MTLYQLAFAISKAATSIVAADLLDAERILVLAPLTLPPAWIDEFEQWIRRTASSVSTHRPSACASPCTSASLGRIFDRLDTQRGPALDLAPLDRRRDEALTFAAPHPAPPGSRFPSFYRCRSAVRP
jgi:hypothetical protein